MNFPYQQTIFLNLGIVFIILVLIYFLWLFLTRGIDLFRSKSKQKHKNESCLSCGVRLFLIFILLWIGFGIITISVFVQSFNSFSDRELVAEVICVESDHPDYTMRFTMIPIRNKKRRTPIHQYFKGDKWYIKGDILKWNRSPFLFGFQSMYRLREVGGEYWAGEARLEIQGMNKNLINDEISGRWKWLYNFGYSLPIVDDIYGYTVSRLPAKNSTYKIYVTEDGFITDLVEKND